MDDQTVIPEMTPDDLAERVLEFSVRVGHVVDNLPETRMGRHVAGQLVRCGTSPGPNYEEACAAESRKDFAHKMSISLKELRETRFWLRFSVKSKLLTEKKLSELIDECHQLCNIFGSSVATVKKSLSKK